MCTHYTSDEGPKFLDLIGTEPKNPEEATGPICPEPVCLWLFSRQSNEVFIVRRCVHEKDTDRVCHWLRHARPGVLQSGQHWLAACHAGCAADRNVVLGR